MRQHKQCGPQRRQWLELCGSHGVTVDHCTAIGQSNAYCSGFVCDGDAAVFGFTSGNAVSNSVASGNSYGYREWQGGGGNAVTGNNFTGNSSGPCTSPAHEYRQHSLLTGVRRLVPPSRRNQHTRIPAAGPRKGSPRGCCILQRQPAVAGVASRRKDVNRDVMKYWALILAATTALVTALSMALEPQFKTYSLFSVGFVNVNPFDVVIVGAIGLMLLRNALHFSPDP